ncbi:MAG: ferredoxin family protein [Desulfarculales bacterium]|jgi:ferredoxin like protein|nr:ferredoxin family protein [Desulfarculales bacterium]
MEYKTVVDDKLALNRFAVDEHHRHITAHAEHMDQNMLNALLAVCPAGLYSLNPQGQLILEYAGCLECGSCRIICASRPGALTWGYPRATKGVFYRYG